MLTERPELNRFDLPRLRSLPELGSLEYRDTVGSTQDLARLLAARPDVKMPALVLARRQTAGRGRGGRRWHSPEGALTFSLVVEPAAIGIPAQSYPPLSLAASLAVCEVVGELAAGMDCGLKWPNDVYLAGYKISGVLVDILPRPAARSERIIFGVGMNVNNTLSSAEPEVAAGATSLLEQTRRRHELTEVLLAVLARLNQELAALARCDRRQAARWQALSLLAGRQVSIEHRSHRTSGRCLGVDEDGGLLLETPTGVQRHLWGTVCQVQPPLGTPIP